MSRVAWTHALIAMLALGACDDDAGPAGGAVLSSPAMDGGAKLDLNLQNDFVPGDPDFVRDSSLDVKNISAHGKSLSHTRSVNCLSCHQDRGPGKGVFTIAGTLLDEKERPYPDAILRLYEKAQAPGGGPVEWGGPVELVDLVIEIEVDANGNFYTTEALPKSFPDEPLYPQFFSEKGEPLFKREGDTHAIMGSGVQVGGCNFCHGKSFPIIGRDEPAELD